MFEQKKILICDIHIYMEKVEKEKEDIGNNKENRKKRRREEFWK